MNQKYQNHVQGYPLTPSNIVPRSDEETANTGNVHRYSSEEQERIMKKRKRAEHIAYIVLFTIVLTIVILVSGLTFMRVKTPKLRLEDVVITNNNGSSNIMFSTRVLVKNRNFGRYKFGSSVATIRSRDNNNILGQFVIEDARARARSTKKMYVVANLGDISNNNSTTTLDLIVEARLKGKVWLIIRRKRTAEMNCTMSVNLATSAVQDLKCK